MAWFDGRGPARRDEPFLCQGELKRAPTLWELFSAQGFDWVDAGYAPGR
jgi:hypothetical protein